MAEPTTASIASRWSKLDTKRSASLERGRQCSRLTIPSVLPPEGHDESTPLPTPYQGLGARGANNLASKLLLALLPPNSSFFRLTVDDYAIEEIAGDKNARAELEKALARIERTVMHDLETAGTRSVVFEALKNLIVAGNVLLFMPEDDGMRLFRLNEYVVRRDPMGAVLEIITKESVAPSSLSEEVIETCQVTQTEETEKNVDVYTQVKRDGKKWKVEQRINDIVVPDSEGQYPLEKTAWIPLRWSAVPGEDYGRGIIEEYLGDLRTLEGLTKAIVRGSAAAAKILFMLHPNASTKPESITDSESGDVVTGIAEDISVLQLDKYADFRVALDTSDRIAQRLAHAFLLNSAIQRSGERVTAEEIRYMAKELEDALGGTYSVLSQEFQLPLVRRKMAQLTKKKRMPELPKGVVEPKITTGLEALGRGHDLDKLRALVENLSVLGPENVAALINMSDYGTRVSTSLGIDARGLIRSEEEIQQQQQQAAMQSMVQGVTPGVAQEVTKGMVQNATGGNNG